jgi:hypothetical protein
MRTLVAVGFCLPLVLAWGCSPKAPSRDTAADKDNALRARLAGRWDRLLDSAPIGYVRVLNPDGKLLMEELRDANAPGARAPVTNPRTMDHTLYKVTLQTIRRDAGSWAVEKGNLIFTIPLASGDSMRLSYKVERVNSSELVLSSTGTEGKTEETFQRGKKE